MTKGLTFFESRSTKVMSNEIRVNERKNFELES